MKAESQIQNTEYRIQMASRMAAKYMLSLVLLCLGLEYLFLFATFGC